MKLIEKLVTKCNVWKWYLLSAKLRKHTGDYAILAFNGELNKKLGTVSIVCDKKGNIGLVKIYRAAIDNMCYEMVRGALEPNLSPEENAIKEAEEELGINLKPSYVKILSQACGDTGLISGYIYYVFLQYEDLTKFDVWGQTNDFYEGIVERKLVNKKEFEKMIKFGEIIDNFTLSAYCLLKVNNLI